MDTSINDLIAEGERKMHQAVEALKKELATVRTGRASPSLIENVLVDYYGAPTPLIQLATIHAVDARQLMIQPFDRQSIGAIDKGIQKADLGLNPTNDGTAIRVIIPALNEDRRRDMVKTVHKRLEEGKVAVRNGRRDVHDHLKALEKEKKASTDEIKRAQERLQKLTDRIIGEMDGLGAEKERDILTV